MPMPLAYKPGQRVRVVRGHTGPNGNQVLPEGATVRVLVAVESGFDRSRATREVRSTRGYIVKDVNAASDENNYPYVWDEDRFSPLT